MKIHTPEEIKVLVIIALASDDTLMEILVLKGGNAINLIYQLGHRGSNDVDYSIADDFDEEIKEISDRIERALVNTFAEKNYTVIDFNFREKPKNLRYDLVDFWGGYKVDFKLVLTEQFKNNETNSDKLRRSAIAINPNGSPKFEIDISKHEYVENRIETQLEGYTIYVYGPEMIVAEKLRAICQQDPLYSNIIHVQTQRGRARDFYDIYQIMENCSIDINSVAYKSLITNIFSAKRVPLEYIGRIANNYNMHAQDYPSLKDTVSKRDTLQSFDFYFNYVTLKFNTLF